MSRESTVDSIKGHRLWSDCL